jgi:hypothetical protein
MRVIRRLRNRSESGMTLTEVIATVVVMGLVIAPLSMTLLQAITLVPDASQRLTLSADNDILVSTLSDDVAQAGVMWHYDARTATVEKTFDAYTDPWVEKDVLADWVIPWSRVECKNTTSADGVPFLKIWHNDASRVQYLIGEVQYGVLVSGSSTYRKVSVYRDYDPDQFDVSGPAAASPRTRTTMLEGYCEADRSIPVYLLAWKPSPPTSRNERVKVVVSLSNDDGSARPPLDITTSVRRTKA